MTEKDTRIKTQKKTRIPSQGQSRPKPEEKGRPDSKAAPHHYHDKKPAQKPQRKVEKTPQAQAKFSPQALLLNESKDLSLGHWVFFVGLLILYFIGLLFFRNLSLKINQQRKQLAILKVQNERLRQLPFELKTWDKEINLVESFFLKKEEVISFFNFLEKISPKEKLSFSFKDQEALNDSRGRPFLRFALTAEGDWQNEITPFLTAFLNGPYLILPEKISLESTNDLFRAAKISVVARIYVDQDFIPGGNQ